MSRNRILAWINLAWHFAVHVAVRLPMRLLRRGRDAQRFLGVVLPEGYIPITSAERDAFPAFMNCIHCGLCSLACPALRDAPAPAWDEAWTFVAGPSRALDRAILADTPPCTRCAECEAVCPTDIPIATMAALVTRIAARSVPVENTSAGGRMKTALAAFILLAGASPVMSQTPAAERPRAREAGVIVGIFQPGAHNAITDVAGVRVGHTTIARENINTGITAILPHAGNPFRERVPAAIVVGNGFGKLIGVSQVRELGELETPILLTCTLCVWRAADAMVDWLLHLPGMENVRSINPVVGETNDGGLNDIRSRPIAPEDVVRALESASEGPVAEGAVGAGAGTSAFGWKGGIGTSSRVVPGSLGGYTVGVLVQSNFGGVLTINGAPVGRELGRYSFQRDVERGGGSNDVDAGDGSIMMIVATDAPLDSRNLERLANRALAGLARTGASMSNGSGDYVIAFSTAQAVRRTGSATDTRQVADLGNDAMSPLFQAVAEATEEAVYNSLFRAHTVRTQRSTVEALPLDRTLEILRKYNALGGGLRPHGG